ncbi:mechanosensitive ion channel [Brucepastera parasyntrophica]|uniref:mechanosensitive ion channel family protein n=1 Tax=Brucepastera parasyntrophica TaxID=2880008 RepID=UPI00210A7C1E|nr:mechanosensitive ion channel domain-containing protein [Brucepastera parasyntrophica]ULQ58843.1 mechanosensitive ion channel [Brucepastera parasyntrophica]
MNLIHLFERWMAPLYTNLSITESAQGIINYILSLVCLSALAFISGKFFRFISGKIIGRTVEKTRGKWDDYMQQSGFFSRLTRLITPIIVYLIIPVFLPVENMVTEFIRRCIVAYIFGNVAYTLAAFLDGINTIYQASNGEMARQKPIKGYLQMIKIFIYIIAIILIITAVMDVSPVGILSGLGAMSAVLMLVFKDSILGFVSSMQLSANDMVRIGDWIEMPKYNADGYVIDITLQSIKVQNWDKTITTIPIYALISDSFKNWRGMSDSGGRRIKRSIYIDMTSVRFLAEDDIKKLSDLRLLSSYLASKIMEIEEHNKKLGVPEHDYVSGRHLTNLGTFRAYIEAYLVDNPNVHQGMTHMVRYLETGAEGLPMELYLYTSDTRWVKYEGILADIVDHLLAVMPEFGLRVFQNPSGWNMDNISKGISCLDNKQKED